MKKISGFSATVSGNGYDVFIYWDKRYHFNSLKSLNKFLTLANNLLFKELFKINELFIAIYGESRRLLFVSEPLQIRTIQTKISEIEELINYCFNPISSEKGFHVISKIEKCYSEIQLLNSLLTHSYSKQSNTVYKYKSTLFDETLENSYRDFLDFKFNRLERLINNHSCKIIKLASNQ